MEQPAAIRTKKGQKQMPVSKELAAILRSTSKIDPRADLEMHLGAIESRRAQETECFLRTCVMRLSQQT